MSMYANDTLVISKNVESILRNELGKYIELKARVKWSTKDLSRWIHEKVALENRAKASAFGSSQYVRNAVINVEKHI